MFKVTLNLEGQSVGIIKCEMPGELTIELERNGIGGVNLLSSTVKVDPAIRALFDEVEKASHEAYDTHLDASDAANRFRDKLWSLRRLLES